jgi:hypothetical protein
MAVNKNFAVKHGLEVNTDLILANASTKKGWYWVYQIQDII